MKSIKDLKSQRCRLLLSLAIDRLDGRLSAEDHAKQVNKIQQAYIAAYNSLFR